MTPRFEICCIRGGKRLHFVRRRLVVDPDAVETFCGLRGLPWPAESSLNPTWCRACKTGVNDEINGVTA